MCLICHVEKNMFYFFKIKQKNSRKFGKMLTVVKSEWLVRWCLHLQYSFVSLYLKLKINFKIKRGLVSAGAHFFTFLWETSDVSLF